ncbi:MAG: serine/threonine-protein kinase [Acidobacteria bacterium]|nr:serine/threonine-protein kinase [Acidobacteriota bacterium]
MQAGPILPSVSLPHIITPPLALLPGTRLGVYEVTAQIGEGGMGQVYRARDTKLDRDVAIKILPEAFAHDTDRLARFQREAKTLASLNHPNIAAIYGLEEGPAEAGHYLRALVMELVEGDELSQRIARGAIPLDEALPIARQIAEALEAAHEQGIVHRDLKPANIKVRADGTVKVLDFGLAKAMEPAAGSSVSNSMSPTFTTPAMTQAGMILGTAAYMSPEQVRGKPLDSRADIWAFGAVVFEMLSGRRLFAGETVSDLMAAVLRADPDWSALPAATPHKLGALIHRCLEREPKRRLRDIGEARIALEDLAAGGDAAAAPVTMVPSAPKRGRVWPWALGLVSTALVGIAVGRFAAVPARPQPRPVRFEITAGAVSSAVVSPDGTHLAIASQGQLWLRDLARLETRPLDKTEGAIRPFWSPDSRTIAYGARGKLWKVLVDGGTPVAVCDLVSGLWDDDAGGAWLADGTIVFSNGNAGLWQVSAQGGDPVEALKPDPRRELHFHTASALPDGRSVVYVVHRAGEGQGSNTLALWSERQAHVILELAGQTVEDPSYSPSGHILFRRFPANAGVWALPFSMKTLKPTGEPFLVSQGMRGPSVASDGTLVLLTPRRQRPVNLAWADRSGKVLSRIDEPRFRQTSAAISPEGDRIAAVEFDGGKGDIWQYDLRRNTRSRLTTNESAADPEWLADGRSLLYSVRTAAGVGVSIKRLTADGSGRAETIGEGSRPVASRDGANLFYSLFEKDGQRLWYRPLTARDAKPAPFVDQVFYSVDAAPSPDGRFVAYEAAPGPDRAQIYLRRFPPSEGMWQVSTSGGTSPRWSRDGRLFFAQGGDIFEVTVAADPDVRIGTPTRLFTRTPSAGTVVPAPFDVSPDGTRFLIYEPVGDATDERITVVLNWFSELPR